MHSASATRNFSYRMWISQVVRFVALHDAWRKDGCEGLLTVLRRDVDSVLRIGCGSKYREECIDYLVNSPQFRLTVLPFLVRNGTFKTRLLGLVIYIVPKKVQYYVLRLLK